MDIHNNLLGTTDTSHFKTGTTLLHHHMQQTSKQHNQEFIGGLTNGANGANGDGGSCSHKRRPGEAQAGAKGEMQPPSMGVRSVPLSS